MSETILTPTTELEAVNAILASVGESPVDTLDDNFVDAQLARNLLRAELRAVQTLGWHHNTEEDVELTPSLADSKIYLPQNTIRAVFSDKAFVQRGRVVYDKTRRSDTFTAPVTVTLILALGFDEVPEPMRRYATLKAGRRFQDQYQSDNVLHQIHQRDELNAWASLLNYEAEVANWNYLDNFTLMQRLRGAR